MTARTLTVMPAVVEITTGVALIANPSFVVHLLIGATLSDGGVAVGRVCGFGLLSLGLACWPSGAIVTAQATSALFIYNLLSAFSGVFPAICCGRRVFSTLCLRSRLCAQHIRQFGGRDLASKRK
jgi:hypothetical protein